MRLFQKFRQKHTRRHNKGICRRRLHFEGLEGRTLMAGLCTVPAPLVPNEPTFEVEVDQANLTDDVDNDQAEKAVDAFVTTDGETRLVAPGIIDDGDAGFRPDTAGSDVIDNGEPGYGVDHLDNINEVCPVDFYELTPGNCGFGLPEEWNADGHDEVGVMSGGDGNGIVGDWDGDGVDELAVTRDGHGLSEPCWPIVGVWSL